MNADPQRESRPQGGTVVVMTPRVPPPAQPGSSSVPVGSDQPAEEPGYGHGV